MSDVPEKFHWLLAVLRPCVPSVKFAYPASRIFRTASSPSSASITARMREPDKAVASSPYKYTPDKVATSIAKIAAANKTSTLEKPHEYSFTKSFFLKNNRAF